MKKLGDFLKGNKPAFAGGAFVFAITVMISLFSLVMTSSDNNAIKMLSLIMPLSLLAIFYVLAKSAAYKDHQAKKNNAARLRNGEQVLPHKLITQYAVYKPFLSCGFAYLPTFILLILYAATDITGFRAVAVFINYAFFVPFANFFDIISPYIVLVGIALCFAVYAVSYIIEGIKLEYQYQQMQKGGR